MDWQGRSEPDPPQPAENSRAASLPPHLQRYAFLLGPSIDEHRLRLAGDEAERTGVLPHHIMLARGWLSEHAYVARITQHIDRTTAAVDGPLTEIIDGVTAGPDAVIASARSALARGRAPLVLGLRQIEWCEPDDERRARADDAAHGLLRRRPELSAGARFEVWQLVAGPTALGLLIGGMIVWPGVTLAVLAALLTVPFMFVVGLRVLALSIILQRRPAAKATRRLPDAELPVYSVLVPMYDEADVLPQLVEALLRLDYPVAKLDVLLVLEAVDDTTQAAARQLALPPHIRVIVVPDIGPRTKPKALNFALGRARGAYVVVYDAEDDPEPDQLRRALDIFRAGSDRLWCVQAGLNIYNSGATWLTAQFTIEYSALFDAVLPALARMRVPVPLGGTSNHFPRAALERLGGWDAYNVTEDADLGIRIAREGGLVAVLGSTTYEEAPPTLAIWMRQRTRWLKGFMLTWLVHMRRPRRLLAELGLLGFLGFHAFLGGIVLSALLHPLFFCWLLMQAMAGDLLVPPQTAPQLALWLAAGFVLLAGYASGMIVAAWAVGCRGATWLIPHIIVMPAYWLLISIPAYRALLQLLRAPYLWEKTPHRPRAGQNPS